VPSVEETRRAEDTYEEPYSKRQRIDQPAKVLVILSRTDSKDPIASSLQDEWSKINSILNDRRDHYWANILPTSHDKKAMWKELESVLILHLAGHGTKDGGFVFNNNVKLSLEEFKRGIVEHGKKLQVVFLNCCDQDKLPKDLVAECDVGFCIFWNGTIDTTVAFEFAGAFYERIAEVKGGLNKGHIVSAFYRAISSLSLDESRRCLAGGSSKPHLVYMSSSTGKGFDIARECTSTVSSPEVVMMSKNLNGEEIQISDKCRILLSPNANIWQPFLPECNECHQSLCSGANPRCVSKIAKFQYEAAMKLKMLQEKKVDSYLPPRVPRMSATGIEDTEGASGDGKKGKTVTKHIKYYNPGVAGALAGPDASLLTDSKELATQAEQAALMALLFVMAIDGVLLALGEIPPPERMESMWGVVSYEGLWGQKGRCVKHALEVMDKIQGVDSGEKTYFRDMYVERVDYAIRCLDHAIEYRRGEVVEEQVKKTRNCLHALRLYMKRVDDIDNWNLESIKL
jgi:hypothetical protein